VPWHIQRHLNISISSKWVPEKFLGT
jgi:hypothetical protein